MAPAQRSSKGTRAACRDATAWVCEENIFVVNDIKKTMAKKENGDTEHVEKQSDVWQPDDGISPRSEAIERRPVYPVDRVGGGRPIGTNGLARDP